MEYGQVQLRVHFGTGFALDFTASVFSMGKRKKSSRKPGGSKKKEPLGLLRALLGHGSSSLYHQKRHSPASSATTKSL